MQQSLDKSTKEKYKVSISGEEAKTNDDCETKNQKIDTQQKEVITKYDNPLKYCGYLITTF